MKPKHERLISDSLFYCFVNFGDGLEDRISNMVLKPWYPTYIRGAGIFIWVSELLLIYLVWSRNFSRALPH